MIHGDAPLLEAIEAIYSASTDPGRWPAALRTLTDLFGACAATLLQSTATGAGAVFASTGIGSEALQLYDQHFVNKDPAVRAAASMPVGTWASTDTLFAPTEYRREEMVADLLIPNGLYRVAGSVLVRTDGEYASLGLHRPRNHREFDERDRHMYTTIQPHLQRALAVTRKLGRANADQQALLESVDRLRTGIVVVDERGKVVLANRAARDIANLDDGFGLTPSGPVGSRSNETALLRTEIASALELSPGARRCRKSIAVQLVRPSGKRPLEVVVTPLRNKNLAGDRGDGRVALYITDPERTAEPPHQWLRELYGLTPAETTVAVSLANGASIDETADGLGVTRNTVRTHLQRILQKTETCRQGELIRVVLGGPVGMVQADSE